MATEECPTCEGEGVNSKGKTCDECDGEGGVDCQACDGLGNQDCETCHGSGEVEEPEEKAEKTPLETVK